jgi:CheY-like chemotaxis protein
MGCPRILLADDHHEMLRKISELLESEFEIVAAVANGGSSLKLPSTWTPISSCTTSRCRSSMD